jgi:hypothetical protein
VQPAAKKARGKPQLYDVRVDAAWTAETTQTVRWNKPVPAATDAEGGGGAGAAGATPAKINIKLLDGTQLVALLASNVVNEGVCQVTVPREGVHSRSVSVLLPFVLPFARPPFGSLLFFYSSVLLVFLPSCRLLHSLCTH